MIKRNIEIVAVDKATPVIKAISRTFDPEFDEAKFDANRERFAIEFDAQVQADMLLMKLGITKSP